MNIGIQISVQVPAFNYLGYISKSRIAGLYRNSVFNFLKNHQPFPQRLYHFTHQQYTRVPLSPNPCQHLLWSVFIVIAILVGMTWYFIVVSICIPLMTNDGEHLFMYSLAICMASLKKYLFKCFAHF